MPSFPELPPKAYNLLSIGQRGVGKTVFLAGSYTQLQDAPLDLVLQEATNGASSSRFALRNSTTERSFWFECQDEWVQANLEKILHHVQKTGLYPPPTIKITNFNFRLKHRVQSSIRTLCNFQWWDIPGESCSLRNEEFQELVLYSHGCCVFISAEALVQDQDYVHALKDTFNQVLAIASIVRQYQLNYPFAFVLTKCDLIEPGSAMQAQIEHSLQAFTMRLDAKKVNYKWFHSGIPIASINGIATLNAQGAADPLLWLLSELNTYHRFQPERSLATHLTEKSLPRRLFVPHWALILVVASISLLGFGASLWLGHESWKQLATPEQRSQ